MSTLLKKILPIYHKLFTGYYSILLVLLLLLFIFRPYENQILHLAIWQFFLTAALLTAVFTGKHSRVMKYIASTLAVPSVLLCWINLIRPLSLIFVVNVTFILIFLLVVSAAVIYDVVLRARVTLETLRGVICAYFMVGILFAYLYYLIEFLYPGSFKLINIEASIFAYADYLSQLIYFSYITLLTVGFGDISPVKDLAQTFVVIEGIIGQFYIAILVARIVSVYSLFADKKLIHTIEEDLGIKKKRGSRK